MSVNFEQELFGDKKQKFSISAGANIKGFELGAGYDGNGFASVQHSVFSFFGGKKDSDSYELIHSGIDGFPDDLKNLFIPDASWKQDNPSDTKDVPFDLSGKIVPVLTAKRSSIRRRPKNLWSRQGRAGAR